MLDKRRLKISSRMKYGAEVKNVDLIGKMTRNQVNFWIEKYKKILEWNQSIIFYS